MITLTTQIYNSNISNYFNENPNDCLIDIETTGLNKITDTIIIIGLLYKNNNKIELIQWIAESLNDEFNILNCFLNSIQQKWRFLSYNGILFDFPFIEKKCILYKLDTFFLEINHFDLFQKLKPHKKILQFKNLKLSTLIETYSETFIQTSSGRDCILDFYNYMKNRSQDLLIKIANHNKIDLLGLCETTKVLIQLDSLLSFNINSLIFNIEKYQFKENLFILSGLIEDTKNNSDAFMEIYKPYYSLIVSKNTKTFELKLYFQSISLKNYIFQVTDSNALHIEKLTNNLPFLPANVLPLKISFSDSSNDKILIDNIKTIFKSIYAKYKK